MSDERREAPASAGEDVAANTNTGVGPDPGAEERAAEPGSADDPIASRVAQLEAELADHKDRALRALAETENVRRRGQRERDDAQKFAVSGFAKDLLASADNLRRALESIPESEIRDERTRNLLAGVAATERELLSVFERHGIKRVDPKGQRFDHNLHQAIYEAENTGKPAGTVIDVLQPGYVLNERLLRPAMVSVAKGDGKPVESSERIDTVV